MKTLLHLSWMRLSESPTKMLYLVITLAAGVLAWMVLSAFASPRLLSESSDAFKARLFIRNARVQFGRYPLRHIPRIQKIPGVTGMTWLNIVSYECENATGKRLTISGEGGDIATIFRKREVSEADLDTWQNTENGVLVGSEAARRCGLNPPGVTVSPHVNGTEMPLHVIAILPEFGGRTDEIIYAHYDYVNRFQRKDQKDTVLSATVRVRNPAMLDEVGTAIEREFESADPPLQAQASVETSILGRFGQVQGLLLLITGAMALCVGLVFCAVLIHLAGQRRASMAVLQTLGFTARTQCLALFLEISGIIALGALLGIGAGYAVLKGLAPWAEKTILGASLHPVDGTVLVLAPTCLLLLVITLIWPSMQIAKLKPIDYLRL